MLTPLLLILPVLAGRQVTLDEALSLAADHSPMNAVADGAVREAEARANGVRSNLGPVVNLQGSVLWWDDVSEASVISGDPCAGLDSLYQGMCEELIGGFTAPILLREARTESFQAKATQPLSPLYQVFQGWKATRSLADAARADADATQSQVATDVVDAYLQTLKVQELAKVADEGIKTLEAHAARGQAFYDAGMIGRNEVLQIQVALSNLGVDKKRAEVGIRMLERRLAQVTGVGDPDLVPAPLDLDADRLPPLEVPDDAIATQIRHTPQIRAMEAKVEAARAGRRAAEADRLPQLAGIANYERYWGLGEMSESEQWYLGLGLNWDVWAWGKKHYAAAEAAARVDQAEAGLKAMQDGLALQARSACEDAGLAREVLRATGVSRTQAEENLRIVTAKFEAHTAAATDLLEAQTLAIKARADEVGALYDDVIAVARAQRALGLPVDPLAGIVLSSPSETGP